ncbi:hypothetical protein BDF20DRAFT_910342 [Mycotypha africana]|uniref:uncharacterized protein n=1 Tax=Mycotypha africana TaxID=64632 RepID=UPI0023013BC5|nr:uncharacterized protein BDF20DRAFT_910342 [Mycotypha africana]KAI8987784.1 hypothetical protein BDF20DRAFT_910342 [Mycotypha africana]
MGLPLWKPREIEDEELNQLNKLELKRLNDSQQLSQRRHHQRLHNISFRSNNNTSNLNEISAPFQPRIRPRVSTARRHSAASATTMERRGSLRPDPSSSVEESFAERMRRAERQRAERRMAARLRIAQQERMDRRLAEQHRREREAAAEALQNTRPPSPLTGRDVFRQQLDQRLQQRLSYKEDLLQQLRATIALLDQFLLAGAAVGSEIVVLPSFILSALPDVIESACSLADMTTVLLSPNREVTAATAEESNDSLALHDMVNRLLQIPPYSTLNQNIDNNILSAHRRIREQLEQFANIGFNISARQQDNNINP